MELYTWVLIMEKVINTQDLDLDSKDHVEEVFIVMILETSIDAPLAFIVN